MARGNDGDVVIKAVLDIDTFKKQIEDLDKTKINDKKIKLELDLENLKKQRTEIVKQMKPYQDQITNMSQGVSKEKILASPEFQEASAKLKELQPQLESIATEITTYEMQLNAINEQIGSNVVEQVKEEVAVKQTTKAVEEKTEEIEKQVDTQKQLTEEVKKTNKEQTQNTLSNTINEATKQSNTLGQTLSKIGKVVGGVAIASIAMIGFAMGMASERSETIKQAIEKIQAMVDVLINKLITMIEPFLPKILPLIEKVLTLIFQIAEALDKVLGPVLEGIIKAVGWIIDGIGWLIEQILSLLGIDISKETSQFAKDLSSASKSLKGTNKEVSKLRKQLLGFDEMNILNSNTGSIGALGGIGGGNSNFKKAVEKDKTALEEFQDQLDKLGDYKFLGGYTNQDTIFGVGAGAFDINKVGDDLVKYAQQFSEFLHTSRSSSEKNGIVTIVGKTGEKLQITRKELDSLVDDLNKKVISKKNLNSWLKIQKVFQDMNVKRYSITQKAIAQGFKDATINYKDGLVYVRLATGETITYTEQEFEGLKQYIHSFADGIVATVDDTTDHINTEIGGVNGVVTGALSSIQYGAQGAATGVTGAFNDIGNSAENNANKTQLNWIGAGAGIIQKFTDNTSSGVKGAVTGALAGIQTSSVDSADKTKKTWIKTAQDIIDKFTGKDDNGVLGAVQGAIDAIKQNDPEINVKPSTQGFAQSLVDTAKNTTITIKNVKVEKKGMKEGIQGAVQGLTIGLGSTVASGVARIGLSVFGAKGLLLGPHLASGGIINRPGRGIPLATGGAIAGERGREAVVPLTDSQQMAYLGREIAKNVVINLTNVTELDGRQLARSVTQVMSDMNFASNGGVI